MKNLLYLVIGLLALTFVACSKDKDDASADADILGVWQGTQWEVAGSGTIVDEGTEMDFELLMLAPYLDKEPYEVTFHPDNTTTSTRDNFTVRTTLKMLGQEFKDEIKIGFSLDGATWRKDGKILYIENDDDSGVVYPYEIKELTSTTLRLELTEIPPAVLENMEGEVINFTGHVKLGMKRK